MSLLESQLNRIYRIGSVMLPEKIEKRLSALGMFAGTNVTVLNKKGGALIVKVRGSRFAIGREIAANITVEVAE